MKRFYTGTVGIELKNRLAEANYEILTIDGCLLDSYICIGPNDTFKNFIIEESFETTNSSCYKIRSCRELSKKLETAVDKLRCGDELEWSEWH